MINERVSSGRSRFNISMKERRPALTLVSNIFIPVPLKDEFSVNDSEVMLIEKELPAQLPVAKALWFERSIADTIHFSIHKFRRFARVHTYIHTYIPLHRRKSSIPILSFFCIGSLQSIYTLKHYYSNLCNMRV
jgi:hypothetical protein